MTIRIYRMSMPTVIHEVTALPRMGEFVVIDNNFFVITCVVHRTDSHPTEIYAAQVRNIPVYRISG
jgi:hypothetical protein